MNSRTLDAFDLRAVSDAICDGRQYFLARFLRRRPLLGGGQPRTVFLLQLRAALVARRGGHPIAAAIARGDWRMLDQLLDDLEAGGDY